MKTFFPATLVTALLLGAPVWAAQQNFSQAPTALYQLAQSGTDAGSNSSSQQNSAAEQPLSAREKPQEAPIYRPGARDNLPAESNQMQTGNPDGQMAPDAGLQRDLDANDAQDVGGLAPILYWLIVPLGLGLMLLYYATSRHKAETAQRREAHPKV